MPVEIRPANKTLYRYPCDLKVIQMHINRRWYCTAIYTDKNLGWYAHDPEPESAAGTVLPLNHEPDDDRANKPAIYWLTDRPN
jgi:hypothetical protein